MNKRIFSLLLVLAMVLTFAPAVAVEANAAEFDPTSFVCPFCKGDAREWINMAEVVGDGSETENLDGHYYVPAEGMEISSNINWDASHANKHICVYLAGDLTSTSVTFAAGCGANINIGGTGSIITSNNAVATSGSGTSVVRFGGDITVKHPDDYTGSNQLISMNGANYDVYVQDNAVIDGGTKSRCAVIWSGDLRITGGTVKNGAADYGGNINLRGGRLYITGGTIQDGAATGDVIDIDGTKYVKGGGNIGAIAGQTFISGGTISGGTAAYNGGSIWFGVDATATISGGAVSGGTSSKATSISFAATAEATEATEHTGGGAIAVTKGATLNISGGVIQGTQATNGGAIFVLGGTVNQTGGTVSAPASKGGTRGGAAYVGDGATYNMGDDAAAEPNAQMIGSTVGYINGGCIQTINGGVLNLYKGANMTGGKSTGTTVGSGGGAILNGGTTNMFAGATITGGTTSNVAPGGNIRNSGTFNMYGGTISDGSNSYTGTAGGNIYSTSTFNMYDGTISGGTVASGAHGGSIYNSGAFNMYDGTITGGAVTGAGQGGNIRNAGTFTMYGGTISNGTCKNNGGNVHISSGTFRMEGGLVTGGVASTYGGNVISHSGTFEGVGGSITNGKAGSGGNIFFLGKTATVSDMTISGGIATNTGANYGGGNVFVRGTTVTFNNCKFIGTEDAAHVAKGGNLFVLNDGTANINDCYLTPASTGGNGKNIYIYSTSATAGGTVNLKNSVVLSPASGNNTYMTDGAKLTLDGLTYIPQVFQENLTAQVTAKAGFVGYAVMRYTDSSLLASYPEGGALPAVLTAEEGYTSLGDIVASAGATAYATTLNDAGTGFVSTGASYKDNGTCTINLFHGGFVGRDTDGYQLFYYDNTEKALQAFNVAACDHAFLRLVQNETDLTYNGSFDLMVNLNGKTVDTLTVANEATKVKVWDNNGKTAIGEIVGGTVPVSFESMGGATMITTGRTNATAYQLTLSTKTYLRPSKETLAFQGIFGLNKAAAANITEIGIKLYDAEGNLINNEPIDYADYAYTANSLTTLKDSGSYSDARVALESEGEKNTWWTHDITVTAYIIVNGETIESEGKTYNFQQAVLDNLDNEDVQNMITNAEAGRFDFVNA